MTAMKPAKKRPGRPRLVEDGDWVRISCKAPPELRDEFNELGGSEWLRGVLADLRQKRLKIRPQD